MYLFASELGCRKWDIPRVSRQPRRMGIIHHYGCLPVYRLTDYV